MGGGGFGELQNRLRPKLKKPRWFREREKPHETCSTHRVLKAIACGGPGMDRGAKGFKIWPRKNTQTTCVLECAKKEKRSISQTGGKKGSGVK